MTGDSGAMAIPGTFETCQHVRFVVAIRGKADIERAALDKASHKYSPSQLSYPPADSALQDVDGRDIGKRK